MSLLSAPWTADAPSGLRVETSRDGRNWETVAQDSALHPGVHWWKGHPRADDSGRVIVRFPPRQGHYVRLTSLGPEWPGAWWGVAELFVYEPATAATRELDHWMDDPTGPHPLRAPVTREHRRRQVPWGSVFAGVDRALTLAPDWEDAHHLYNSTSTR